MFTKYFLFMKKFREMFSEGIQLQTQLLNNFYSGRERLAIKALFSLGHSYK